ncbi:MAG: hypothetical protein HOP24_01645 [Sideroxydans sp.]|nr:hypothetical protein [Sideroxydans sp.]
MPTSHFLCMPNNALVIAEKHVRDILRLAIRHAPPHAALVVFDKNSTLSVTLTAAYQRCLPNAVLMDFDEVTPEAIFAQFDKLVPADLVVLIQSSNFRLEAFRIRVELFKRGLKVVEHPHLARMQGAECDLYIDALAYDADYFRSTGQSLKRHIDAAPYGAIESGGELLHIASPFEPAKLNVGDYSEMNNVGGQFPIGEVFTEALDLEAVNGRVRIFAFGDTAFATNIPDIPITLVVEKGRVTQALNSTPEFDLVMDNIRADEGEIWLRELGFGLNRAFTKERVVNDIGTYERMCGMHLSLGAKHGSYSKPQIRRASARHHVDVFAVTESVTLGDAEVYRDGAWIN